MHAGLSKKKKTLSLSTPGVSLSVLIENVHES